IPKEIWLNTDLSIIEKVLLVEIDSLDNSDRGCFASNEYLAKFVQLSEGRVANIISDLKKRKFIIQVFFDGRNRGLRISKSESSFNENVKPDLTKTGKQTTRKREHNNTVNKTDNNTTNIECENSFTPPQPKIKNSFARQSIHDSISYEQGFKEKEKSTREKEKETRADRPEPSETYSAFIAYCQAYEQCAKVTLPKNRQGNYVMTAKDGSNCKKLVAWIRQIAVVEGTMDDMVAAFTKAAWHVSDKFMKNNFSISMIYSQANAIYTKFHYQNPAAQEKRRQEEIDRLVNEFEG
ncbi:MAG: helix-turn-helix domain-containing protein, partial [Caulobacteraceae bacterium]|nr:helix-turn-helix domain-containing protein [Caulobacteraceae bacterium]